LITGEVCAQLSALELVQPATAAATPINPTIQAHFKASVMEVPLLYRRFGRHATQSNR
jgi:hypothetical protein